VMYRSSYSFAGDNIQRCIWECKGFVEDFSEEPRVRGAG
jgi:hypothetical protein